MVNNNNFYIVYIPKDIINVGREIINAYDNYTFKCELLERYNGNESFIPIIFRNINYACILTECNNHGCLCEELI